MAHSATLTRLPLLAPLILVARAISGWISQLIEIKSLSEELQRLSSMTDQQLADIGLTRGDIVKHVFRDMVSL